VIVPLRTLVMASERLLFIVNDLFYLMVILIDGNKVRIDVYRCVSTCVVPLPVTAHDSGVSDSIEYSCLISVSAHDSDVAHSNAYL